MQEVKRMGVLSFAKLQALLMAFLGLVAGVLYSFGGAVYDLFTVGLNLGTALAFFALLGMPSLFAAVGFILGLIEALLYNLFARRFGGIAVEMDLAQKVKRPPWRAG